MVQKIGVVSSKVLALGCLGCLLSTNTTSIPTAETNLQRLECACLNGQGEEGPRPWIYCSEPEARLS